jgi:hypothetical protein
MSVRDKSLSVFLMKGYVFNNQVKAERCENCKAISEVLTVNYGNPNLLLYGCRDTKCKQKILKLDFEDDVSKSSIFTQA